MEVGLLSLKDGSEGNLRIAIIHLDKLEGDQLKKRNDMKKDGFRWSKAKLFLGFWSSIERRFFSGKKDTISIPIGPVTRWSLFLRNYHHIPAHYRSYDNARFRLG